MIKELMNKLQKQKSELNKYYKYYIGKHKITEESGYTENKLGGNLKEVHNYCKLFIDNNTGYLLGNSVSIKMSEVFELEDITLIDEYDGIVGNYIQQIDQLLLKTIQIFGFAYEVNYVNKDGVFSTVIKKPTEMAVKVEGKKIQYGLIERSSDEKGQYYDFFDVLGKEIITYYIENNNTVPVEIKRIKNIFNNPIILVKNNHERISEIEDIYILNDAYNQVSSDLTNEISDHRNSYLGVYGAKLTESIVKAAKKHGIFGIPEGKEIKWIIKEINDNFVQNKLNQLETQMYNLAGQVNFNDTNIGSNTSSLALRNKLIMLDNKLTLKEGFLKEAILLRFENLKTYLRITKNINPNDEKYNIRSMQLNFIRNIPTSTSEMSETMIKLVAANLLSKETAISNLGIVDNARAELLKIEEENQSNDISLNELLKELQSSEKDG